MATIIQHPKTEGGAAARLHQLRKNVEQDRARAIAGLNVALAKLDVLRARCDAPVLEALTEEYAGLIGVLGRLDPANIDDGLPDRLALIQLRLMTGLGALEDLIKTAGTTPHDSQEELHDQ